MRINRKHNAVLFTSIHYNSSTSKNASEVDTFYDHAHVNEAELARYIQAELVKQTGMKGCGVQAV
ncbi:N-acetylmuramoyl-L-alanine amidase [Bacillus sp. V5-8f]|uniref:N-acetylmuramoyl-L-alanine amidase n=1 Tax=Bacillus sp. V5-8f TaxID=2053044 RepID=UPI001C61001F|nr:N-acetylmuramoyl-L-alanine amidase [Bacillus sp. V5-8f]